MTRHDIKYWSKINDGGNIVAQLTEDTERLMLILERKLNEIISIQTPSGDVIDIELIETNRGKAKIGVDAPDDYLILRDELIDEDEFETTE